MFTIGCIGICFNLISFVVYLRQKCHKTFHRLREWDGGDAETDIVLSQVVVLAGHHRHSPPGVLPPLLLRAETLSHLPHQHLSPHSSLHSASSPGTISLSKFLLIVDNTLQRRL